MPDVAELLSAGGTAFSSRAVIHPFNSCPYSPECVEGEFCEVHIQGTAYPQSLDSSHGILAVYVPQSQPQYLALPYKDALWRMPTRDVQNAQPLKVRFPVLLTEGDTEVLL